METSPHSLRRRIRSTLIASTALLLATLLALVLSQAAPASSTAKASGSSGVRIANFEFHPGTLRVSKGTTVVFSNASTKTHTATRRGSFNTGRIRPGTSVSVRFTRKGVFSYHCEIHHFMHGKIVVG